MSRPAGSPPPLPHRAVTFHRQRDVVLLHWRIAPALAADLVPPGCRPDEFDGSAWVGLVAYVFADSTVPPLPPLGRLGTMVEITVEIPTVDDQGRPGVFHRSIDTQHLPAIVLARLGIGLPYTFARAGSRWLAGDIAYRSRRPHGPSVRLRATPGEPVPVGDALAAFLTERWGVHARHVGRTSWWRLQHAPWTLYRADLVELDESLLAAAGLESLSSRPPDSVLFTPGAEVRYSRG